MCEFCTKHGDGKRWYLQAKNYSDDLVRDARRQKIIQDVVGGAFSDAAASELKRKFDQIDRLDALPRPVRGLVSRIVTRRMKRDHFGQVVPIEDVGEIFRMVTTIVRVPCVCRRTVRGHEHRYCMGVSLKPDLGAFGAAIAGSYAAGPDVASFERLTADGALELLRSWEHDGLVHSVWTFGTPFIGGVCNCDRSDCLAMIATVGRGVKVMFRAEHIAAVDWDLCRGCRACMRVCQFGAIGFSAGQRKAFVAQDACYGCGVCRAVCPHGAIALAERASAPAAAGVW